MTARRPVRTVRTLVLATALGLVAASFSPGAASATPGAPVSASVGPPVAVAAAAAAGNPGGTTAVCPPDWLGTTTNTEPQISADGRFVVFTGYGPDGEIGDWTIFLRDRVRNRTSVISDPDQVRLNFLPSISANGNRISYLSRATDDFSNEAEIWVYDRRTRTRTFEGISFIITPPRLDADGSRLTFTRLENGNTNLESIFARDVNRDREYLVSANRAGRPGNGTSFDPEISANGRFVLFRSYASDLTAAGVGTGGALFVRDLRTAKTRKIPARGPESPYQTAQHLSPEGRFVLYTDPAGVWRYDRRTGRTIAVTRADDTGSAGIGTAGRKVLLRNLRSLFVRDVRTGRETPVDHLPDGSVDPSGGGYPGAMTPNGRYVVLYSGAQDLDPNESGVAWTNVYVRDLRRGTTELISSTDPGGRCGQKS